MVVAEDAWFVIAHRVAAATGGATTSLLFGSYRNGCHFGNVSLGEVLVFEGAVSDTEVEGVEAYLAHKWRVAL